MDWVIVHLHFQEQVLIKYWEIDLVFYFVYTQSIIMTVKTYVIRTFAYYP